MLPPSETPRPAETTSFFAAIAVLTLASAAWTILVFILKWQRDDSANNITTTWAFSPSANSTTTKNGAKWKAFSTTLAKTSLPRTSKRGVIREPSTSYATRPLTSRSYTTTTTTTQLLRSSSPARPHTASPLPTTTKPPSSPPSFYPPPEHYCTTVDCATTANMLTSSIRADRDPCTNFFSYVCSGILERYRPWGYDTLVFLRRNVTEQIINFITTIAAPRRHQSASEKASAFFQGCTHSSMKRDENVQALLRFTEDNHLGFSSNSSFSPVNTIIRLVFAYNTHALFTVAMNNQFLYKKKFMYDFEKSDSFGTWTRRRPKDGPTYLRYVFRVLQVLGITEYRRAKSTAERIIHAENYVFEISRQVYSGRISQWYLFDLANVGYWIRRDLGQEWSRALERNSNGRLPGGLHIRGKAEVFIFLQSLLTMLSAQELKTYLTWELIRHLSGRFGLVERKIPSQLVTECYVTTSEVMRQAFVSPYLFAIVNESRWTDVRRIGRSIQQRFEDTLLKNTWLDAPSLRATLTKLRRVRWKLAFATGFQDKASVEKYYENYPDIREPFLSSFFETSRAHTSKLQEVVTKRDADIMAVDFRNDDANAAYSKLSNIVIFPATILFPPVYTYGGLPAVNYGSLGHIFAHELMHAFDRHGIEYDGSGERRAIWTGYSRRIARERGDCLLRSAKTAPLRRKRSLNDEYLADFMGFHVLFSAYTAARMRTSVVMRGLEHFSSDQLFFISWCFTFCSSYTRRNPSHPLPSHRCNVPFLNSAEFSRAFACPVGAPMNARRKCSFWGKKQNVVLTHR